MRRLSKKANPNGNFPLSVGARHASPEKRRPYNDVFGLATHHGRGMPRPYKPMMMFIANPEKVFFR